MGAKPLLTGRSESRNGVTSIVLSGELDASTVSILRDHLALAEGDGGRSLVLDLRELTFVDSTGLHAFLTAREGARLNGHRFILIGVGPPVRRLLELTRTEFLLDEHEAVSVLAQFTGDHEGRANRSAGRRTDADA